MEAGGETYEGGWLLDRPFGEGVHTSPADGSTYKGQLQNGKRHGEGLRAGVELIRK